MEARAAILDGVMGSYFRPYMYTMPVESISLARVMAVGIEVGMWWGGGLGGGALGVGGGGGGGRTRRGIFLSGGGFCCKGRGLD